jgi:hypothetical protein
VASTEAAQRKSAKALWRTSCRPGAESSSSPAPKIEPYSATVSTSLSAGSPIGPRHPVRQQLLLLILAPAGTAQLACSPTEVAAKLDHAVRSAAASASASAASAAAAAAASTPSLAISPLQSGALRCPTRP